jgi:hypothetical protein
LYVECPCDVRRSIEVQAGLRRDAPAGKKSEPSACTTGTTGLPSIAFTRL